MLGTSGTVTTMAGIHLRLPRYDRRRVDGLWMSAHEIDGVLDELLAMTYEDRVANACIGPDRADLVMAGCAILEAIRRAFPCERLRVADRGLREGLLVQMMEEDRVWHRERCGPPLVTGRSKGGNGTGTGGGKKGSGEKGSSGRGYGGPRARRSPRRSARGRTHSSQLWLERQLNDPYVARAKREGYRSRAVYKLIEIDDRLHLLKPGLRVLDLGAAPGGWSQLASDRTKALEGRGRVVAIDLLPVDPIPGVQLVQMDFMADEAPETLRSMLGGPADLVLSDMAANTVGHRQTDHLQDRRFGRSRSAFRRRGAGARRAHSSPRSSRVAPRATVLTLLKQNFRGVKHVKPGASRAGSSEIYVLATGFKGRSQAER